MKLLSLVLLMLFGVSIIDCQIVANPCFSSLTLGVNMSLNILIKVLNTITPQTACNLNTTTFGCSLLQGFPGVPTGLKFTAYCLLAVGLNILNLQFATCLAVLLITGYQSGSTVGIPLPVAGATDCTNTVTQLNCVLSFIQQNSAFCSNACVKQVFLQLLCAIKLDSALSSTVASGSACANGLNNITTTLNAFTTCGNVQTDCPSIDCLSIVKRAPGINITGGPPAGK